MKKLLLLALLSATFAGQAQESKHEFNWNIANTIIFASIEVGYEYLIDNHQSVGATMLFNDTYNMSFGREIKDFDTNSFRVSYNYYTGEQNDEFVISPFMKFRTGEYQKTESDPVVDMDSFILGIGGAYKWNFNNKFVFGPFVDLGRNFSSEVNDEFNAAVEFYMGFNVGYRF